jgi:hypothetical protein
MLIKFNLSTREGYLSHLFVTRKYALKNKKKKKKYKNIHDRRFERNLLCDIAMYYLMSNQRSTLSDQ